ncbi:MAG: hypothetical protein JSV99_07890 [Planctomycetota bacterium]|nr:MAG: hypothetical protein JSV99_07890 [Planctomycetota bacterium]
MSDSTRNIMMVVLAPDFGHLVIAVLFVLGCYWCYHVVSGLRSDLEEIRELKDKARTAGFIIVWTVTAIIATALAVFTVRFIITTISGIRDLL